MNNPLAPTIGLDIDNLINEEEDLMEQHSKFEEAIQREIGVELPFHISLFEHYNIERAIEELNEEFTKQDVIMIKDDRIYSIESYLKYPNPQPPQYTPVYKPKDKEYISIKDILQTLGHDEYYKTFNQYYEVNHRFLEGFEQDSEVQYSMFFGS